MASDIQETPFVKQLAANALSRTSIPFILAIRQHPRYTLKFPVQEQFTNVFHLAPDRPTRDAALLSLRTYLSNQHRPLTPLSHLKIWKGLFYSLWMCDRPQPQASLCASLASLLPVLPAASRVPFLHAFWQTMAREWTNIDVLRMEKFLLLVRRMLAGMFGLMATGGWEGEETVQLLALLEEVPLEVGNPRLPNGLRYHVIDIYVDELEQAGALEERMQLEPLLEPLKKLGKDSPTKDVRRKCREALEDERLPGNKKIVKEDEMVDGEWGGIQD